jgi:hypothetical protein
MHKRYFYKILNVVLINAHHVMCLFSFDITKHIINDRRSTLTTECNYRIAIKNKTCVLIFESIFNLRHYSVVNDLNLSSRYLINCISNTRGRSQTETSTSSIVVPNIIAIIRLQDMWIILLEVHYCTVEQVSHILQGKST